MENNQKWVSFFGCAHSLHQRLAESYGKDLTLRYPVVCPYDAEKIRLTLSSYYVDENVKIDKVTLGKGVAGTPSQIAGSARRVTFGGENEVVLGKARDYLSDPVEIDVKAGDTLCVNIYMKGFTNLSAGTSTSGPRSLHFFISGDFCEAAELPFEELRDEGSYRFLVGMDALTDEENGAIVAFGDSITAQSWPEELAMLFEKNGDPFSVARRGVSGNRILREYTAQKYRQNGATGVKRFEHECEVSGAKAVVVLHGVNDLIHPDGSSATRPWSDLPTAEQLAKGLTFYAETAHRMGLKIVFCTVTPIEGWRTYNEERNRIRCKFNEWIRMQKISDGVADLDLALRDPDRETALLPAYDCGDHLHPASAGAKRIADEIYRVLTEKVL